jgi:hypothetical protein
VKGLCVGKCQDPIRADASLEFTSATGLCSEDRRRMYTAWMPPIEGLWVPRVHANCYHNEAAALLKRSLGPTPCCAESSRGPVLDAFGKIRRVARRYEQSRWDYRTTAESYTGLLRRRYLEAERSLLNDGPISLKDYRLGAFLKAEKRVPEVVAKPRMIFPRSPRYNLALASWLKPFEHWLWGNLRSVGTKGVTRTRVVAKGLNGHQRAGLIRRKMSNVPGCVVFEVDGKAFEAHCDVWQLLQEHSVYETAYPGSGGLKRLLNKQLRNFGRTSGGLKFVREGGRASGDFNTGMGNTLIMLAIVSAVMTRLGTRVYDSLVDGDNALLFIRRRDLPWVVENFSAVALEVSGHEMILERPVGTIEEVRFGQSAPVETRAGWTMVRDWKKVLSQGTSSHAHLREPGFRREFLQGISLCELSLAREVPILGAWAESLRRATELTRTVRLHPHRDYQALGVSLETVKDAKYVEPTDISRSSFERAFGVSPTRQRLIEAVLFQSSFSLEEFQLVEADEIISQDVRYYV